MHFSKKQIAILVLGVVFVVTLVVLFMFNKRETPVGGGVTVTVWGTESRVAMGALINAYIAGQPSAAVSYREFDEATYEEKLVDALAAGEGPDVFQIANTALPKHKGKLVPIAPESLNIITMRELYPTVVEQDFVDGGRIYALPLYIDTLALLYNKNLFDQAGIVAPPKTWTDFQNYVPRLRLLGSENQIVRAGAAIGGSSKSIHSAVDLLSLLMLQNGTPIVEPGTRHPAFGREGQSAFDFYLQFADPRSPNYTWNDSRENALDNFAAGKTAMMFGYKKDIPTIKSKGPFVNVGVAPTPQLLGGEAVVSYPRYNGLAVSKQSKSIALAWDFVFRATTDFTMEKAFLDASGEPPALRALVGVAVGDPELSVFARQALTARSWYQPDDKRAQAILSEAIASVLKGVSSAPEALSAAEFQIGSLIMR